MTQKTLTELEQLDRLTETLVADVLDLTDEEVLAEAATDYADPRAEAERIRGVFEKAIARAAKAKLIATQNAVAAHKTMPVENDPVVIPLATKRAVINRFVSQNQELQKKLTLAARKGHGIETENDINGMFDDLVELGIIDEQGNPKP